MRVFLPDSDRKVAAKPTSQKNQSNQSQQQSNKLSGASSSSSLSSSSEERKPPAQQQHLQHHGVARQEQEEQPSRKKIKFSSGGYLSPTNTTDNLASIMGGGGRLLGGPTKSTTGADAVLKSSGNSIGRDVNSNDGPNNRDESGGRDEEEKNDVAEEGFVDEAATGPHAAVAAAASSQPHRSTINSTRSSRMSNPEDDEEDGDEWRDNDSKQAPHCIFLGKSNTSSRNEIDQYGNIMDNDNHPSSTARRAKKSNRTNSSLSSSSSMHSSTSAGAASSAAASRPLLLPNNAIIPGSEDDPATMSKTEYNHMMVGNNPAINVDNDENNDSTNHAEVLSKFIELLRTRHKPPLDMVEMDGDGNCLFRAISLQVYGDASMHMEVRRHCLDFMERESDHFRNFVADEEFHQYIARKRLEGVHGNHTEIQAMSELYNRSIEVFVPGNGIEPINIFHSEYKSVDAPIRLCYQDGNHYDAVVDPLLPTAGLGLGLPGLQPGLADKLQLEEAKKISSESALEEKMRLAFEESNRTSLAREEIEMKEALRKSCELATATGSGAAAVDSDDDVYKKKAMYLSEIEAADFDLEQAVLASSIESYHQAEQERKPPSSRRGEGRRSRFNSSPRGLRSSSNSPVYRTNTAASSAMSPSSNQYASAAAASSTSAAASSHAAAGGITTDEYPASVQELVMNGFELSKVLRAAELIGDNFDDLLSFLLSSTT